MLWERTTSELQKRGYEGIEVNHPSIIGPNQKTAGLMVDAANVRSIAERLLDQGKKAVLVGNSYGGYALFFAHSCSASLLTLDDRSLVITEAAKGLDKAEREADGKLGLTHLVYIGSLLCPLGLTCNELLSHAAAVNPAEGQTKTILDPPGPPEAVGAMLMSELSADDQKHYGQLKSQSALAFDEKLTHQGYLHTPTTVVIPLRDKAVAVNQQHESAETVIANGAKNINKVTIDTDHCAMLTRPEEVVRILIDVSK